MKDIREENNKNKDKVKEFLEKLKNVLEACTKDIDKILELISD